MKLTRTERWILSNQYKILSILDQESSDYYIRNKKIIDDGFELLYKDCIEYIYEDDETLSESDCRLVLDILTMFSSISFALEKIDDKSDIDIGILKFSGFDGNNEGKYSAFAKFFCTEFHGRLFSEIGVGLDNFNSHFPFLDTYRRMLEAWETSKDKHHLTRDDLIKLSNAAIHPEYRK